MEDRREGTSRGVEQGKSGGWVLYGALNTPKIQIYGTRWLISKITLYSLVQHLYSRLFVGSYSFRIDVVQIAYIDTLR